MGTVQSCGCIHSEYITNLNKAKAKDLTNQKFGLLTAIKIVNTTHLGNYWLCKCDCGNECIKLASTLIREKALSCGCLNMSKGELIIENLLKKNNITYKT